jgi:hypothetical protein
MPRGVRQAIEISREAFLLGAWRNSLEIALSGGKRTMEFSP